jgi:hypothetical protein
MKRWLILILWGGLVLNAGSSRASDSFPRLPDWQGPSEIQSYGPDNLFDAINGAADLFLAYGFRELQVAEYKGPGRASVLVEVYAHTTPRQAFGVYSQERNPQAQYLEAEAQAYVEEGSGFSGLVKGTHYVKISGTDLGPQAAHILETFALEFSKRLPGEAKPPALLSVFPAEGKIPHSELYVDRNVLGYPFLKAGFTADYARDGVNYRLFVLEGEDPAGAEAMLQAYLAKLGRKEEAGGGAMTLDDPHHGPLGVVRKGRYLAGVLNVADSLLRLKRVEELAANLPR